MGLREIRWRRAVAAFLAAEAALIAAAFGWVAIYSHLVNPGHDVQFYEAYAQRAVPYAALLLGIPVFFLACRWAGNRATALAVFGLFCLVEIATLLGSGSTAAALWFEAVNIPVKLLTCLWGAASVRRPA